MSESQFKKYQNILNDMNITVEFDRDNSDYIYNRIDLANLSGKAYHKKKNLVNSFKNNYEFTIEKLNASNIEDAKKVLNLWKAKIVFNGSRTAAGFVIVPPLEPSPKILT